jgi:hypothetical protein
LRQQQTFHSVLALAGFPEQILGAAPDNVHAVTDKGIQEHPQSHQLGTIAIQRQQNHTHRRLQRRILEELIQHHVAVRIPLQHNMQPNLPRRHIPIRQVNDPRNSLDPLFRYQHLQLFTNAVPSLHIGDLGHHNHVRVPLGLKMSP